MTREEYLHSRTHRVISGGFAAAMVLAAYYFSPMLAVGLLAYMAGVASARDIARDLKDDARR
jgi:hypothetical protein